MSLCGLLRETQSQGYPTLRYFRAGIDATFAYQIAKRKSADYLASRPLRYIGESPNTVSAAVLGKGLDAMDCQRDGNCDNWYILTPLLLHLFYVFYMFRALLIFLWAFRLRWEVP